MRSSVLLLVAGVVACGVASESNVGGVPVSPPPTTVAHRPCDAFTRADCIADGNGIFVDGINGVDGRAGTRAEPLKTLAGAMAANAKVIFLCATTYPETIVGLGALTVIGGLRCGDFSSTKERPTLRGVSVEQELRMSDVRVVAPAGTLVSPSSGAVRCNGSYLELVRCDVVADRAADGTDGQLDTGPAFPPQTSLDGTSASGGTPGTGGNATKGCQFQNWVGGTGGVVGGNGGGWGYYKKWAGLHADCVQLGTGGGDGDDGKDGADFATSSGDGEYGETGYPGGGGGGGNAGAGGGGGAGGCLGRPGKHGTTGGSSIALTLGCPKVVQIRESTIVAGDGGKGGSGHPGSPGMSGGSGGLGAGDGCRGGRGGHGGHGGAAAGAAGGDSVAILLSCETTIDMDGVSKLLHGTGGLGGMDGKSRPNPPPAGRSADVLVVPPPPPRPG